ncbi:uncharacterized protein LOC118430037 [Branchiostoma floridae]|uniref:Uncharacterized protein LOC118430037 n=1 Tax=Branchiostoma floridae TaxID=7739 RepID=A0A9J7NAD2_BRAFL|nr:uncharacterized protein LOC118430037 [Branchiostoma floridae]
MLEQENQQEKSGDNGTNPQPGPSAPRYLQMEDHLWEYPRDEGEACYDQHYEQGETYDYKDPEDVNFPDTAEAEMAGDSIMLKQEDQRDIGDASSGNSTDPHPGSPKPRYLQVGDHMLEYPTDEGETCYDQHYEQREPHVYEKPEDASSAGMDGAEKIAEKNANKMTEEGDRHATGDDPDAAASGNSDTDPHPGPSVVRCPQGEDHKPEDPRDKDETGSHQNFKEEDPGENKEPEDVSFAKKTRARVMAMWGRAKASKVLWFILGRGLLVIALIVSTATLAHIIGSRIKEREPHHGNDHEKAGDPGTPLLMTTFGIMENSSQVGHSTSPFSPSDAETRESPTRFGLNVDTLPVTVTSLPTTGITSLSTTARCQGDWSEYNGHCYKLMTDKVNWFKANEQCKQHDGNLASIMDEAETRFIKDIIKSAPSGFNPSVWLGLHKDRNWKWSDGSPVTYTNWGPGEPNNFFLFRGIEGEKCAGVYFKTGRDFFIGPHRKMGQWNDLNCNKEFSFLCKTLN